MAWGLPSRDMKHYIFEKLVIKDRLPLVPLPQLWGVKTEQEEIVIPEGIEALKAVVDKEFPKESEGLRRYLRAMRGSSKLAGRMPADMNFFSFFIFPITHLPFVLRDMWRKRESVGERMDKYMQSSKLKNLLNINAAYYSNFSVYYQILKH